MFFAAPLFLIGLVAVAIPVAVHLFNFRRYKKVYFSNVERLEQLQTETRRQSKLRQLLVLAARIMAIVFLVLAFARPVLPDGDAAMRTGSNDVSIYLDNSFSMENTDGNGTLLEKAKTKAREIVAAYGPSDRFHLMTNDAEGRHFHWLSKEEVLQMIDEVEVGPTTATLSTLARRQFDFLRGGSSNNRYAYIVSDFQVSVVDMEEFPSDSSIVTTFVPLESATQNNVSIDSLAFNAPVFYKGNSVTAQVWLRNEGEEDLEKVPVTLYVNERQRALATVDLPAMGVASVELHFTIDEEGILNGRVETTDYPVTFDDRYFFSLNIRNRINALAVEGGTPNEYLHRLFDGDTSVHYSSISLRQMDFSRIGDNDVVILDELPSLTTGMAQTLHTFVEEGGTVVVVPADEADMASYNEALRLFAAPQLAGYSKGRVAAGTVNTDNALYRNVFSGASRDMEMPTVTGYYRLAYDGSTLRDAVITLANGDDYLCVVPCGSGRLYLFTAPLRDAHTDFVRQALFVPTLYNMALYSVRVTPLAATLGQGEPVLLSGLYDGGEGTVRLTGDNGFEEIPDLRRMGNRCSLVLHGTPSQAGNYILSQDGKPVEGVSFNFSRLESQMQFLGRDALTQMLKDYNLKECSVVRNVDKPLDSYLKEQMEGRRLWRLCLVLSLLMLLAEVILVKSGR